MEFCSGGTLQDLIQREKPLSEARALELIHRIAAALEFVHATGVVHRDIKPANLLCTGDGEGMIGLVIGLMIGFMIGLMMG